MMECKICGAQVDEKMRFCMQCGTILTPATVVADRPAAQNEEVVADVPVSHEVPSSSYQNTVKLREERGRELGWTAFIWSMLSALFNGSLLGMIFAIIARTFVNKSLLAGAKLAGHIRAAKILSTVTLIYSIVTIALLAMYYLFFLSFYFVFLIMSLLML